MATSLSGSISVQASINYQNGLDMRAVADAVSYTQALTLTNGTGASQATMFWADTRTTDATGETIDLIGGGLTDGFGIAVAPTRIVALIVTAAAANATAGAGSTSLDIWMSREATAGFGLLKTDGHALVIGPGATLLYMIPTATALAVATGDTDQIKFAASNTGNVTYTIIVVGS